jgi:ribonuclease HI
MKHLQLPADDISAMEAGQKSQLYVIDDIQNFNLDDQVEVINPQHEAVGSLVVNQVNVRHLIDMPDQNLVLKSLASEQTVDPSAPIKELHFSYTKYTQKRPLAGIDVEATTDFTEVKLYGDGGSRGNPGPAASGWVVYDLNDTVIKEGGYYMGITTNNQAEYTALKLGLKDARKLGAKRVQVFMDSLLVVNQMKGLWKIKNQELLAINIAIKALAREFEKVTYTHVPRALNSAADRMVNITLDDVAAGN